MTVRVSWLPFVANSRVASVWLRSLRPMEYLRRAGWDVGLHSPDRRADVVIFQKAYGPEHLAEAERLVRAGVGVVADFCDNHLWVPEWTPELRARADRMRQLATLATTRVASTPALGEVLEDAGAGPVRLVNDALPLPRRATSTALGAWHRTRGWPSLRLLWFGTAGGGGQTGGIVDLGRVMPALARLSDDVPIRLTVVSNSRQAFREHAHGEVRSSYLPWSRAAFHIAAAMSDIAVIPVSLDPFTRCKSSNRPASALLAGLACVADPVPSYAELGAGVQVGDWEDLLRVYSRPSKRAPHVNAGQAAARQIYAAENITRQWEAVLHSALDADPRP